MTSSKTATACKVSGREAGQCELHGEVGGAPELDVGAGAVAGGDEASALDPIAPELAVLEPRGGHGGERAAQGIAAGHRRSGSSVGSRS